MPLPTKYLYIRCRPAYKKWAQSLRGPGQDLSDIVQIALERYAESVGAQPPPNRAESNSPTYNQLRAEIERLRLELDAKRG
jgi:hypothetical protein